MAEKPKFTPNDIYDRLSSGGYVAWKQPVITYTMDNGAVSFESRPDHWLQQNIIPMTETEMRMVTNAFELWDDLIAPKLDRVEDRASAKIELNYMFARAGATSQTSVIDKTDVIPGYEKALIFVPDHEFNRHGELLSNRFPTYGDHIFYGSYLHEIGHALGLKEPNDYGLPDPNDPASFNYANKADFLQDSKQYMVMSYWNEWETPTGAMWFVDRSGERVHIEPQTPMLYDIATIQALYGADMHTREGDTVYGFNSFFSALGPEGVYNFTVNRHPVMTIYDAGGNDTLDLSGFSQQQHIDLRPGHYSSVGGLTHNIAMAYNSKVITDAAA